MKQNIIENIKDHLIIGLFILCCIFYPPAMSPTKKDFERQLQEKMKRLENEKN